MAEDPQKVARTKAWLDSLSTTGSGTWVDIKGYNVMPAVKMGNDGKFIIDSAQGYVAKIFLNQRTGELRLFPYGLVEE